LIELRREDNLAKLSQIARTYEKYFADDLRNVPSKSTLSRLFCRVNLTHKVTSLKNVHASAEDQYAYLQNVAVLDPNTLVDIDETLCTQSEFERKYGWSPVGEEARQFQIKIGTKAYSTIAAYTSLGFLCWAIYEGSVSHTEFVHFLKEYLAPVLPVGTTALLDNASIHKTEESTAVLEQVCDGQYIYVPPYSPELKPIEKGFALVKRYVRENENVALTDPIAYINKAFMIYSVHGERCSTGTRCICP